MSLLRDRLLILLLKLSNYLEYVYPVIFIIGICVFIFLPAQDICKAGHVYERALLADYVHRYFILMILYFTM
jgi:hypothetical protein